MRLINASAYKAILKGWLSEMHAGEDEEENAEGTAIYSCICQLDDAPTVDAVVVTRCKDCKHRTETGNCGHPRHHGILPSAYPYDFCNYGERRGGGDDNVSD